MSCFRPIRGTLVPGGRVVLGGDPTGKGRPLQLPCGKCIGCKMDKARMWSVRITHEASLYDSNIFVTFDYNPKSLPSSLSLVYSDFQLFMKRFRKKHRGVNASPNGSYPIRFFCAGEYGSKYQRPHWHAIFFNVDLADKIKFHNETFRSESLESLWGKGNCVIGTVTPRSAAYVAGYTLYKKGHSGDYEDVVNVETGVLSSRRPEFVVMSRRPGIGAWWYEKFKNDLFPHDKAVMPEGRVQKVPRYYLEKLKRSDPLIAEEISYTRYLSSLEHPEEGTDERLAVREEYAVRKLDTFSKRDH